MFYGKLMDLSGLTRVWVAYDYEGTLANLERGFDAENKLAPTQDDIAVRHRDDASRSPGRHC